MGLNHAFVEFLTSAAVGAATVLLIILFLGLGMAKRSSVPVRRNQR